MEPLIPRVYITDKVVADMAAEVLAHPHIETAWGIYGLRTISGDIIVTGVMLPSPHDIVRGYATTSFGGQRAAAELTWLHDNWKLMSALGMNPTGAEFLFLYKGHSHHQLDYARYSGTDEQSILEAVRDEGLEVAIGPLAICNVPPPRITNLKRRQGISYCTSQYVRFVFYYLDKAMVASGITKAVIIQPGIFKATDVPVTPPAGWQFSHEVEFERELQLLRSYGCKVAVNYRDIEGGPPFEIQLVIERPTWSHYLFITTFWDHPATPPKFQIVGGSRKIVSDVHFAGSDELKEGPVWAAGQSLLEAVFRFEARGEL